MAFALLTNIGSTVFADGDTVCAHSNSILHKPRADVNYNPSPIMADAPIEIPLTIDIAKRYDIDLPEGVEMKHDLGIVTIYNDGRIMYDNNDISGNIEDKCKNNDTSEFETIIKNQTN